MAVTLSKIGSNRTGQDYVTRYYMIGEVDNTT